MDLAQHIQRQAAFSRATFGPGPCTLGVSDHIHKELAEIAGSDNDPEEWVDVVILALDGLWRSLEGRVLWNKIGEQAEFLIRTKQGINEQREWPDWRTAEPGKAIEHMRTGE